MKKVFEKKGWVFLVWIGLLAVAGAQEPEGEEDWANVDIFNASGHPLELEMEVVRPDQQVEDFQMTLEPGRDVGLFSQPPGKMEVRLAMENREPLDGHLKLKARESNFYLVYPQLIEKKVNGQVEKKPGLAIRKVKALSDEPGFSLTVVSVSAKPRLFQVAGHSLRLEPGQSVLLPGWNGKGFGLSFEGKEVAKVGEKEEAAPYLLVLFDDEKGDVNFIDLFYALRD